MISIYSVHHNTLQFGALHYVPGTNIAERFAQDLVDSGLTINDIQANKMVVDFRCEGQCNITAQPLIEYLQSIPVKDLLVVYNTCVDVDQLLYRAISMPNWLVVHETWLSLLQSIPYNDNIDRKFLCLMRMPSVSRATIAQSLQDVSSIRMSFGSMCQPSFMTEYQDLFSEVELPIVIDGIIDRATNNIEHVQTNPVFHSCLFNLVVESSNQTDVGIWRSRFITEKSFKAFGLRQIPLWFAVPGHVKEVRKLGFDMFDDIVDHSYDMIENQQQRFNTVIQQIHKLDREFDIGQCQTLRRKIVDRLHKNFELLEYHYNSVLAFHQKTLKEFYEN